MRLNRGSNERNMAKYELAPCYPINVGWHPKPERIRVRPEDRKAKPVKKSHVIMSEIKKENDK